jgi:hypothetical protein
MIGNLVGRREQTQNEAVQQNGHSTRRALARLPFADHLNRFIAGDRAPGSPEGTEALAGAHSAFDGPVVLFQNIVQILYGTMLAILFEGTFGFEPHDRGWVGGVMVGVNNPRLGRWFAPPKALL